MIRTVSVAAMLALVACYAPPGEPDPAKLRVEALLPTPFLDAPRAACTARILQADAASAAPRVAHGDRVDYMYRLITPTERPFAWDTPGYQASYDAAEEAARALTVARAAQGAAARVSEHAQSAVDYAELALAHERAFRAAAEGKERARRGAEQILRRMTTSQPDLEALYQQRFEARYRTGGCSGPTPSPRTRLDAARAMPLLPTPLLDAARSTCAAATVAARAAGWREVYLREIGELADLPATPPGPVAGFAWTDWRAARAFAELAALHTSAFALFTTTGQDDARRAGEARLRRASREHPDLEALYQRAFDEAYRAGGCAPVTR